MKLYSEIIKTVNEAIHKIIYDKYEYMDGVIVSYNNNGYVEIKHDGEVEITKTNSILYKFEILNHKPLCLRKEQILNIIDRKTI